MWFILVKFILLMIFAKQRNSLGFFDRGCIRPQQLDLLSAIVEDWDVLSAHIQPHTQLLMADTKTPKVGVDIALWSKFLLADDLAIYHKAWQYWYICFIYCLLVSLFFISTECLRGRTWSWVSDQRENGSLFVVDVEAQSVVSVWQLYHEMRIAIHCKSII